MIGFASEQIRAEEPMAGLIIGFAYLPVRHLIEDPAIIAVCGVPADLENQVWILPL